MYTSLSIFHSRRLTRLLAIALMLISATTQAATSADQFVKTHADQVLARVLANKSELKAHPERLYSLIRTDVMPHLDFRSMSQSVLGKNWNKGSAAEQNAFVKEFSQLLVRTYGTALLNYSGQAIDYKPAQLSDGGKYAVVRTKVPNAGGSAVSIDYRLRGQGGSWKVVDIKVGGVSLVSNYRTSFASQVSQVGVGGLVKQLQDKNRK